MPVSSFRCVKRSIWQGRGVLARGPACAPGNRRRSQSGSTGQVVAWRSLSCPIAGTAVRAMDTPPVQPQSLLHPTEPHTRCSACRCVPDTVRLHAARWVQIVSFAGRRGRGGIARAQTLPCNSCACGSLWFWLDPTLPWARFMRVGIFCGEEGSEILGLVVCVCAPCRRPGSGVVRSTGAPPAVPANSSMSHASSTAPSTVPSMSNAYSGMQTISHGGSNADMEQALHDTVSRAEAAEDRLLRSMARFSKISPLADKISAHRGGSATIAGVESRNEMNEPALWETFLTASPVQYLKAELKTPTQTAILERNLGRFEVGVPLIGGSLNMKLLPDLTISKVQRDDLDCQEGDRIVEVEGIPVSSIDHLRVHLTDRTEITLVIESGGTPLFTIHDASTPYWEVTTIPPATQVRGSLRPGDLVLRINDIPVAGLDTRKALDSSYAKISLLPSDSQLAQRIKAEGLMSFTTQVEVSVSKEQSAPQDPKYNIILTNFEPEMFAGVYIVGVFLGRHQVGSEFQLEIVEGAADAKRSNVLRDGLWQVMAGQNLDFKFVGYDSAGNRKTKGGDLVTVENAQTKDLGNGVHAISWSQTQVGNRMIDIRINGEAMQGTPQIEVIPFEVFLPSCQPTLSSTIHGFSLASKTKNVQWSVIAGTNACVSLKLFDKYGNLRPPGEDRVVMIQSHPCFSNEKIDTEIALKPTGIGLYEYQGLIVHATGKNNNKEFDFINITLKVNGETVPCGPMTIDVHPADVSLDKCLATVTPAGITSPAGEKFEFDLVVKDMWENLRNHTEDVVEIFELNPQTKQRGDAWTQYEVASTGHGTYRVTASQTLARQTRFTFAVNGIVAQAQIHSYLLTIVPSEINIEQCVVTGELTATVGQYIALLIALRDRFGNVCSPQQMQDVELSVAKAELVSGCIDPKDLVLVNRVSRVDFHPGIIYTHQIVLSTEQAVQVALELHLGKKLLHSTKITFETDELDADACEMNGLPPTVICGESFALQMRLSDVFKNGIMGHESTIAAGATDSLGNAAQVLKVKCQEHTNGNYVVEFKILTASPALQFRIRVLNRVVFVKPVEALAGPAKAKTSEVDMIDECRIHFPLLLRGMLRDEFGNVANTDENPPVVKIDGCGLRQNGALVFLERGGSFSISCTPRRSGDLRIQIFVTGELLADRRISVRSLSSWTKEDAAEWVLTLGMIEPTIRAISRTLSQEFVSQNVTGAKIAGGLLDRGALHFAFGLEDMQVAQFVANVILDLNKGHDGIKCCLPWSWTLQMPGPLKLVRLEATHRQYLKIAESFLLSMPNAIITSIERVENVALYERYCEVRTSIAYICGGNPSERFLWYCSESGADINGLLESGFTRAKLDGIIQKEHMVLGYGFHFAPDAKVPEHMQGASQGGDKSVILARVACGRTATRDILGASGSVLEDLAKIENRIPPAGFQAATSQQRTELLVYYEHCAYPEFIVNYQTSYRVDVKWPGPQGSALLKLEDVQLDL